MKKLLSLMLVIAMVCIMMAGCGKKDTPAASGDGEKAAADVKVAMITDYGDITDQSFNQTTYEACKAFCDKNGVKFTYYKPASDSDEDRIAMIESAIDEGYNVVVMPGYAFGKAIEATADNYSDVTFIALDVSAGDFSENYKIPSNLYSAVYQEELCGYMAGFAAVKLGYKNLGFLGGMAVPAVQRYGYGFVQGADAAAKEAGLTDVTMKYAYGNQFYGDADITAAMDTWYAGGVEIVFACGGGIFTSAAEAAAKVGGKVIGVDVDQKGIIDGTYGDGMTVTSAMKGLAATVNTMLGVVVDGKFSEYGGKIDTLGLVSEDPAANYVQLAESTQFGDGFSQDDYKALVADMFGGKVTVSNDITKSASDFATVIALEDQGNIK
ncbi:MAG: BMP family ABC transporter substrate-binding protein [Firmicutes bacterium]|nr:BMP family ABC transporter substrate-binding protein [Bacillota bacterium]